MDASNPEKEKEDSFDQNLVHNFAFEHGYAKPWYEKNCISFDFSEALHIFNKPETATYFDEADLFATNESTITREDDSKTLANEKLSIPVEKTNGKDAIKIENLTSCEKVPESRRSQRNRVARFDPKQAKRVEDDRKFESFTIDPIATRRTRRSFPSNHTVETDTVATRSKRARRNTKSLPTSPELGARSSELSVNSTKCDEDDSSYHDLRRVTRSSVKIYQTEESEVKVSSRTGKLVWAHCTGWWPAILIDAEHVGAKETEEKVWVFWIGEGLISQLNERTKIEPFSTNVEERLVTYLDDNQGFTKSRLKASVVTLKLISLKLNVELQKPYHEWAKIHVVNSDKLDTFRFYPFPRKIKRRLDDLKAENVKKAQKHERRTKNDSRSSNSSDEESSSSRSKSPRKPSPNGGKQKSEESPRTVVEPHILPLENQKPGAIVWGKIIGHPWWPAMIMHYHDCSSKEPSFACQWILWYGDYQLSQVHYQQIMKFEDGFVKMYDQVMRCRRERFAAGVLNACKDYCARLGMMTEDWTMDDVSAWIATLDGNSEPRTPANWNCGDLEVRYSAHMVDKLKEIKCNQKVAAEREDNIMKCEYREVILERPSEIQYLVCIICLAIPSGKSEEHPFFDCIVCEECAEELKSKVFAYGDDGKCFYCTLCAGSGTIAMCDSYDCTRAYCTACLKYVLCPDNYEDILIKDPWNCFLCERMSDEPRISTRNDWNSRLAALFRTDEDTHWDDIHTNNGLKRKIRVLSLFDGIATGLFVLEKLGIQVEKYYAAEIDDNAMFVSTVHFGDKIHRLGDVRTITREVVRNISPIDLLIGGSPCNDLSLANPNRLGLHDPNGTGVLFFDYCRIKKLVNKANKGRHMFWLYENVASMPSKYRFEINRHLGRQPYLIDSSDHSPQHRPRLFWSNLPISSNFPPPDPSQDLQSVLIPNCNRHALVKKIQTVTTRVNSLKQGKGLLRPVLMNGENDSIWITELEAIFGFPRHYTDVKNLSATKRQKLIGQSWSVQTITAILRPLSHFFESISKGTDLSES